MERTEGLDEATHNAIESAKARAKLSPEQLMVLDAIIAGGSLRLAWMPMAELVGAAHSPDVIEGMVQAGLVVEWMLVGEMQVTLSEHSSWLMQVHILERLSIRGEEIEEDPYWAELDKEAPSLHLPKRRHEIRWPWMDELPDPKSVRRAGEVMRDDDGEPRQVMGRVVPIDPKLKGAKGTGKGGAKPKARKAG